MAENTPPGPTFRPGTYRPRPRRSTVTSTRPTGPTPARPARTRRTPTSLARGANPVLTATSGRGPGGGIHARMDGRAGHPMRRISTITVVFALVMVMLVGRLVQLQVLSPDRYVALGESQRVRSVELPAERGMILDRNGAELALSLPQQTVWADPRLIADPDRTARQLTELLDTPVEMLRERLSRDGAAFVYLQRRVDAEVATAVEELEIDGIFFLEEPRRFTPSGDLALSLLGQVGVDNNGLSGLESLYDSALRGVSGELLVERDPQGNRIPAGRQQMVSPIRGHDLVLTIDRTLQWEAEQVLRQRVIDMEAEGGTAIVTRPSTGEVLAMANVTVDESSGQIEASRANLAVVNVFEPGSVAKVITVAAALEEGIVDPDTVFEVPWQYRVSTHTFTDHEPHPVEMLTVSDILRVSSNVGTIKLAQMLGPEKLHEYFQKFGVGSPTSLNFPGESGGLLLPTSQWSGTSLATIAIGQGISLTPMQMLGAFNVIASDGVYVGPSLVKSTIDGEGVEHPVERTPRVRVLSEETARQMREMLRGVVDSGTATRAAIDQYPVGGKTGTARKPLEDARGYEPGAYFATFGGIVPITDPELSIIVVLDEPRVSIFGGVASAPAFAEIARYALRELKIPPPIEVAAPTRDASAAGDDEGVVDQSVPAEEPALVRAAPATTVPASTGPETADGTDVGDDTASASGTD